MTATVAAAVLLGAAVLVPAAVRAPPRAGRAWRPCGRASLRPTWTRTTSSRPAALLAGVAAALVLGGLPGLVVGVLAATATARVLSRLEPAAARRRAETVRQQAPLAGDLLVAALRSGAPLVVALTAVGRAVHEPLGPALGRVGRALELGAPGTEAWAELLADPVTAVLARPMSRAAERGSAPTAALTAAAAELRREAEDAALAAAEVAAVRAVAPLGACFLPAFVLLGVVPLVVAMTQALLWSG